MTHPNVVFGQLVSDLCGLFTKYESDLGATAQITAVRQAFVQAAGYYEEIGNYTRADRFGDMAMVLLNALEPTSRDPAPEERAG